MVHHFSRFHIYALIHDLCLSLSLSDPAHSTWLTPVHHLYKWHSLVSLYEQYTTAYKHSTFPIHSPTNRHPGCFHILAIANSAATNTEVYTSPQIMVFSGYRPRSGTTGPHGSSTSIATYFKHYHVLWLLFVPLVKSVPLILHQLLKGRKCIFVSVQFSSVAQLCPTFGDPMNRGTPGLPVHHQLPLLPKLMSIESVMPSSHLILCCPLLLLPPVPPSIRVFSNESILHMRWPKYWSFSFSISPSNGLISFRMDWLDLLAVQSIP